MALKREKHPSPMGLGLRKKWNMMNVVILRDMRTRFFNHGLGFLIQSLWPLVHMLVILTISAVSGCTGFGACCLCLGLLLERVLRRQLKEG